MSMLRSWRRLRSSASTAGFGAISRFVGGEGVQDVWFEQPIAPCQDGPARGLGAALYGRSGAACVPSRAFTAASAPVSEGPTTTRDQAEGGLEDSEARAGGSSEEGSEYESSEDEEESEHEQDSGSESEGEGQPEGGMTPHRSMQFVADAIAQLTGDAVSMDELREAMAELQIAPEHLQECLEGNDDDADADARGEEHERTLREDEVRAVLARWNGGQRVSSGQYASFVAAFQKPARAHFPAGITQSVLDALQTLIDRGSIQAAELLTPSLSTAAGAEEWLKSRLSGLSKTAEAALNDAASKDDNVFYFLSRNFHLLEKDPSTTILQLIEVHKLHSRDVTRGFEEGYGKSLPPQVAVSAMKPLNVESSHRVGMAITLFPPQRITLGAYIDFSKVVRPLRAKASVKRTRNKDLFDIYHRE